MNNKTTVNSRIDEIVQFIDEDEVKEEMGEAFASVMLNPTVTWAKFVLTDDSPNGNKQRISKEEFANLIRSGVFMPIKMAYNEIKDGHDESKPLGVITHLKEDKNKVLALAALWSKERPTDVEMLKDRFNKNLPINISWEISYSDSVLEDGGVQSLVGTQLTAATIVGMPAYAGRTPMIAFAAKKWSQAYIATLPDSSFLYVEQEKEKDSSGKTLQQFRHFPVLDAEGSLDLIRVNEVETEIGGSDLPKETLESVRNQMTKLVEAHVSGESLELPVKETILTMDEKEFNELKAKLALADAKVTELETKVNELTASMTEKDSALASKETALAELQAFKDEVESKKAEAAKMQSIKDKFAAAKIERPDEYFETNKEFLLKQEDGNIDFMLQEMASFASSNDKTTVASAKVPNLKGTVDKTEISDLVKALNEQKK